METGVLFKPFVWPLAFCASLFGGPDPAQDRETELPPAPASIQEQYVGNWKQSSDSQCTVQLEVVASQEGILRFRLQGSKTVHTGVAEATDYWLYTGEVASLNYDASVPVLILRNIPGEDGTAPLPECNEDLVVLERSGQ